jgi:hypothetical protein
MKTSFLKGISLFVFFVLCLTFISTTTMAQDTSTPVATVEATPVPETPPAPSNDNLITVSVWQIVAGLAGAFSIGGLTVGTALGVLASRLRKNPETMAAIEALGKSTPESTIKLILGLTNRVQYAAEEVGGLVRETFDGKPARDKTPEERDAVVHADTSAL